MSSFHFTEDGMEDYLYWQIHDKQILKRINSLLKSVARTPFTGEGKPEPLKGEKGKWSEESMTQIALYTVMKMIP